jgi:hypothetical protein
MMTITIENSNAAIIVNVTSGDGSSKQLHLNSWGNFEIVTFQQQRARNLFISKMSQALVQSTGGIADSQAIVRDLLAELPAADVHPNISALRRDIVSDAAPELQEGQVSKAFSRADWLQKWGLHYLKSLVRAHALQECSNFKDPGVQVYGGPLFKQLQAAADTLFVSMPAPVPTARSNAPTYSSVYVPYSSYSSSTPARAPAPAPAPVQMDRYMDRYGGCLHASGRVLLLNGTIKQVKHLRQGDVLPSGSRVRCNVQLSIHAPLPMCRLPGGLLITPWHPVRFTGSDSWCFPADVCVAEPVYVKNVYNLVLDSQHSLLVDGVSCVTLGHGFTHDRVVAHAFFGSSAGPVPLPFLSTHRASLCPLPPSHLAPSLNLFLLYLQFWIFCLCRQAGRRVWCAAVEWL